MDEETRCYVGFSVFPGIGPTRFSLLRTYFGNAREAWRAPLSELLHVHLHEKLAREFDVFRKKFDAGDGEQYLRALEKLHVSVLPITDIRYPKLLSQISDAPFLLYIKGKKTRTPLNLTRTIAVVGTRKVTSYGREVTTRLTRELVAYGFTIVSGLAYGVDAVAHQAALDAGGKTIAVLGCGIDIIAPACNERLYYEIANGGGAIISEMPLGHKPLKGLFPARNRIISGLSLGVVVTEGADDSGALITARNAGEQGREVFAVPGPITSTYSRGPAKLLKNGAKLVESVHDIIEELGIRENKQTRLRQGYDGYVNELKNEEEKRLVELLRDRPMAIDEIVRESGLTAKIAGATITILEMKGIIKDYGNKEYGLQ